MNKQETKEFWMMFVVGVVLGVFFTWQTWFSITLYRWVNRPGEVIHNYMTEIL